jgi:NTE family protein
MDRLKRLHIHAISAEQEMQKFSVLSKFNADWDFLLGLKDIGRQHAADWLDRHFDSIGLRSTVNIDKTYL